MGCLYLNGLTVKNEKFYSGFPTQWIVAETHARLMMASDVPSCASGLSGLSGFAVY